MRAGDRRFVLGLSLFWIVLSILMVLAATAPFRFTDDTQIVLMKIAHVSPHPLADTWARTPRWVPVTSVALDVVFFLPFGVIGGLAQKRASIQPRARRLLAVTLLGFLLSMGIETLQVFTRDRIPSSADLVANTLGATLGAWLVLRRVA